MQDADSSTGLTRLPAVVTVKCGLPNLASSTPCAHGEHCQQNQAVYGAVGPGGWKDATWVLSFPRPQFLPHKREVGRS